MQILTAADAHLYVATYAYLGTGFEAPSVATLTALLGRTIASRYEYIAAWAGRGLTAAGEGDLLEAIGVLRLAYFRLTGRAWVA